MALAKSESAERKLFWLMIASRSSLTEDALAIWLLISVNTEQGDQSRALDLFNAIICRNNLPYLSITFERTFSFILIVKKRAREAQALCEMVLVERTCVRLHQKSSLSLFWQTEI